MSLQKKTTKKKIKDADIPVESYGVCSRDETFTEKRKFILHLRVHPSKMPRYSASEELQPVNTSMPLDYKNDTYSDLMRYNPKISNLPSAYEETITDSYPSYVITDESKTLDNEEESIKQENNTKHQEPFPNIVNHSSSMCIKCKPEQTNELPLNTSDASTAEKKLHQHCWWCTYDFDHEAFSVPIGVASNKQYNTIGCFCSPECAASYIFDNKCNVCDVWKQYEMLHRMINKMHNGMEILIKLAPPREVLQRYGGPYNIETYRNILQDYRKHVRISMPPINPVQKLIEEVVVDYTQKHHKFLPIDTSRVKKAENELCLKRKKKRSSENSLEAFMQLRMHNKT